MKRVLLAVFILTAWSAVTFADDHILPAYRLPWEKEFPAPAMDPVTPPPTEPIRFIAEFEPQQGIQMAYPWGSSIESTFIEIVREAQAVGEVYIIVANAAVQSQCSNTLSSHGVPLGNVVFYQHATDAFWSRDYGPHFLEGQTSGQNLMVDWQYYPSRPNDNAIPEFLSQQWGMQYFESAMYHEGGNIMSDGHGLMMCSTVLYDRNPSWSQAQCQQELQSYYGATRVEVYQRISIDGTGHIDLWGKLLNDHVCMVADMAAGDPNDALVDAHAAAIDALATHSGGTFDVVRCPMPPLYGSWPNQYYKSFLNSLIINNKVLVPIYNTEPVLSPQALQAYQNAMPGYQVVGIPSDNIASYAGAIHCTTIGIAPHNGTPTPILVAAFTGDYEAGKVNLNWTTASEIDVYGFNVLRNAGGGFEVINEQIIPAKGNATETTSYSFTDANVSAGWEYSYALQVIYTDGCRETLNRADVTTLAYELAQNSPNPFNPTTSIRYSLPEAGFATLMVFDAQGRKVADLVNAHQQPGAYQVTFDASDLASGVYFYKLQAGDYQALKKMVLTK